MKFVFFGTTEFSVGILKDLKEAGYAPELVVTMPDRPAGRGMRLTPPPVKNWAEENGVDYIQPRILDESVIRRLSDLDSRLFLVAAYGKILPQKLLDIPAKGALNVHASLLPKLRGAAPIETAILRDEPEAAGITIFLMDAGMDTGPIVAQTPVEVPKWPPKYEGLKEALLAAAGGLVATTLPKWVAGEITPRPQDEAGATYTRKSTKEDALVDLDGDAHQNLLKIRALSGLKPYFFHTAPDGAKTRVIIKEAELRDGKLRLSRVVPEGKKEMSGDEFAGRYGEVEGTNAAASLPR